MALTAVEFLALQGCSEALKSPVGVKVEDSSSRLRLEWDLPSYHVDRQEEDA